MRWDNLNWQVTVLPVRLYIGAFSHLVRVLDVTVGEVGRTPAADLVTDVDTGRDEDREDGEDVHGEATVEAVTETVPAAAPVGPSCRQTPWTTYPSSSISRLRVSLDGEVSRVEIGWSGFHCGMLPTMISTVAGLCGSLVWRRASGDKCYAEWNPVN